MRILTSLILLISLNSFSQSDQLDSLLNVWNDTKISAEDRLLAIDTYIKKGPLMTKPDTAFILAEEQFKLAEETKNTEFMARARSVQGSTYYYRRDVKKADQYYDMAIELYMHTSDSSGLAFCYANKAVLYQILGDNKTAIELFSEGVKIREAIGDSAGIAGDLNNIAVMERYLGNFDKSISLLNRCIRLAKSFGNDQGLATYYGNLGIAYDWSGEWEKASDYYLKSMKLSEEIGFKMGELRANGNMSNLYVNKGEFPKGLELMIKVASIAEELGDNMMMGICEMNVGGIYGRLGAYDKALEHYETSLALNRQVGNSRQIAEVLGNIGSIYDFKGERDKALEYYRESLAINETLQNPRGISSTYNNMGLVYRRNEMLDSADHYLAKGLKMRSDVGLYDDLPESYNNLATVYYRRGEFERAHDSLVISRRIVNELNLRPQFQQTGSTQFLVYGALDSVDQAGKVVNELLDNTSETIEINFPVQSESEKEQYFPTFSPVFSYYYGFSLDHGKDRPSYLERSFDLAIENKGLLLKSSSAMRNSILSSGDSVLIDQYFHWISLKRRIAQANASGDNVNELEEEANAIEKELVKNSSDFRDVRKIRELSWKSVQSGLKDGEVAVEMVRFTHQTDFKSVDANEEIYCALIVKPDSKYPEMVRLFAEDELEKILGTFPGNNLTYIEQIYGTGQNTKTQLYDLIWKPMEESLKGTQKVFVSPVGLLHKISFAALAREQDVYLCDLYEMENMSSTGRLAMESENAMHATDFSYTVFGGVDYNSDSTQTELWSYLDGSLTEAEMIKKTLKKNDVNYYVAKEATEESFKEMAHKSNILHIATHGFFYPDPEAVEEEIVDLEESSEDLAFRGGKSGFGVESFVKNKNPLMRSGLALAGANDVWSRTQTDGEDGVLTAAEVATIDMRNTELVVLSACETGLGDIKGSEGVYGLQRSFKMAGVNYIIMSLWQVPDKETAEFMTTFYKHLTKTNDIKQSFNLTQKAMRKKYDPYYWAAFVLVE